MNLDEQIRKELDKSPLVRALIAATPEYAIIFDLEGKVQSLNERMLLFLKENPYINFSNYEDTKYSCQINNYDRNCEFFSKCDTCMFKSLVEEVKINKAPVFDREGFLHIKTKMKSKKISIIYNLFPFEYEGVPYIIFSFRDIDNIKEYERKRINDLKKLSIIGESVASIVHDLKNPLTGLYGYLELMKIKENKMELIPKMENALEIIRTTLEDIMSLTAEEEDMILDRRYEDIRDMVMDVINLLHIEEITHLDIRGKTVAYIDKIKFHNVLWNLIKNAYESFDDDDDEIVIKIYKDNKNLIIEISDTGKGIAEEHKKELFKAGKTFGKNNGTGFGLANAKKIVEAHGGSISFSSELGKGTSFLVKIPNDS